MLPKCKQDPHRQNTRNNKQTHPTQEKNEYHSFERRAIMTGVSSDFWLEVVINRIRDSAEKPVRTLMPFNKIQECLPTSPALPDQGNRFCANFLHPDPFVFLFF